MRGRRLALALFFLAPLARADESGTRPPVSAVEAENESGFENWILRRKHTLAEAEIGFFAIPSAPISAGQKGGNLPIGAIGHGDATALVGTHLLYRGDRDWAIGAGALIAPLPTQDDTYGGVTGLSRTHARSYLWLGVEGRYIPLHFKAFEGWLGLTAGTIIVADRFTTNAGDPAPQILGSKTVTVETGGGSVGLQLGGDWLFAERLVAGFVARLDHWVLPATPTCTPIGDCATLTGPLTELEAGLRIGYRIPL
jgi:hypothetical protein